MTTQEAAAILNKSAKWVRVQCATGAIKSSKYGATYNIAEETVTAFIDSHTVTGKPAIPRRRRPRRLP